ncbi:hypothetical protein HDV00_000499 [Rhizophlyctis rosea]|nr:hypothetical protein HDV00_000499 [Rhizophlyctis rosea]
MFTILVAKFTADALGRAGLYDAAIKRSGHPYLDGKRVYGEGDRDVNLHEVMETIGPEGVVEVGKGYWVEELGGKMAFMGRRKDSGFPVLDGDMLVGYVGCTELQHALDVVKSGHNPDWPVMFFRGTGDATLSESDTLEIEAPQDLSPHSGANKPPASLRDQYHDFTRWVDQAPIQVPDTASVELVAEMFVKLGVRTICVVRDGRLVGVVHKKKLVAVLGDDE